MSDTEEELNSLVDLVLGAPRSLTSEEVARGAGVSLDYARKLWRALGFADVGGAREFTELDRSALRLMVTLLDRGAVDGRTSVDVARSLGQTTSRLADWQLDTFTRLLIERGRVDGDNPLSPNSADALRREFAVLLPAMEKLLIHSWRRQLAAVLESSLADAPGAGEANDGVLTVGFADLAGFTRLTRRMEESEVAALVERFESNAADIVAAAGGRLVKTLGDEVMFTCAEATTALDIAFGLHDVQAADPETGRLRIGLATGPVVSRRGDVFGTTVNLASRLTASARPGTVLVDPQTAIAVEAEFAATPAGDAAVGVHQRSRVRATPQGPRILRGLGVVRPVLMSRPSDP